MHFTVYASLHVRFISFDIEPMKMIDDIVLVQSAS